MKDKATLDREFINARNSYDEAIATNDWSAADHYEREMDRLDEEIAAWEDEHCQPMGYKFCYSEKKI